MNNRPKDRTYDFITLGELYDINSEGKFSMFDYNNRRDSSYKYRVPLHQRYNDWKPKKISKLIDSVMNNYSLGGFIASKHIEDNIDYYDIEDGQSRLSVLQQFYNDEKFWITTDDNGEERKYKFSELDKSYQDKFKRYKFCIEILHNFEKDDIHELFERLQEGVPLKDKDHYWNLKDKNLVKYSLELVEEDYWIDEYMGTDKKPINDKHRDRLPDVCAIVSSISHMVIKNDKITGNIITPSFRTQRDYIDLEITDSNKSDIKRFLDYYNIIIKTIYQGREGANKRTFYKAAKDLGLILCEWLQTVKTISPLDKTKSEQTYIDKWVKVISYDLDNDNFMGGSKRLWDGLRSQEKQNTSDDCLIKRLNKVNEWYSNNL